MGKKGEIILERLLAISKTNLISDTDDELQDYIKEISEEYSLHERKKSFSLKDNSVSNKLKTGFIASAIYHELQDVIGKETNYMIDLDKLMELYKEADDYRRNNKWFFKELSKKENAMSALHYMIFEELDMEYCDFAENIKKKELWKEELIKAESSVNLHLLLLMAIGIIPFYSGKGHTNNYSVERLITEYLPHTCFKDNVESYLEHMNVCNVQYPKIKSIYNLIQFTNIARSSLSIDLFHSIAENLQNIPELDVNYNMEENSEAKGSKNNMPVIWYDNKGTEFWLIYNLSIGYKFYKCDYSAKTYRIYTVFLGSEASADTANILHPKLNPIIYENKHNPRYISLASWEFTTSKTKQELIFKLLGDSNKDEDLISDFRSLKLVRLKNNHSHYGTFCNCLEYKNDCWQLKSYYENEYPGTDYFYYPSLYSVSKDGIQVQKVRETDTGYELIENEYYFVESSWIDDIDTMRLTDSVGVIFLTDEKGRKKKYLALDCYALYFPIKDDDTIDFDILDDE